MKKIAFDPEKTLYLVDGTSFSYRAFFAIRDLRNSQGFPTGAVFGFVNILKKILKEFKPLYLGICFDVSRKTFRQDKFKDYKITRPPTPDELKLQIPRIQEVVKALRIPIAQMPGYEADDVIATLADKAKEFGFKCLVFSSDKDILQIVEDKTVMLYNPNKEILLDEQRVLKDMGVAPRNIPDLLGLCGDSTDNIPGVKGIGPKNAVNLIESFGSIENILENMQKIPRDSLRKLIAESKDSAFLSKDLATLDRAVPIDLKLEDLKIGLPDKDRLCSIFRELEFKSLMKEFSSSAPGSDVSVKEYSPSVAKKIKQDKEFIFYICRESVYIYFSGLIYKAAPGKIQEHLEDPDIKKVTFDIKEAILQFAKYNIRLRLPFFDVMIASFILKSHLQDLSLEDIIWEHLNIAQQEIDQLSKVSFIERVYRVLEDKLKNHSLDKLFYEIETPLAEVLAWMESSSIGIDLDFLKKYLSSLKEKQSSLEKEIFDTAGLKFNLNSPKQLSEILFSKLGLKPVKRTKTGFSTNEEALSKLKTKHPVIEKILSYRKLTKLLSTYIEPFISQAQAHKGKIFTRFSQVSTSTGRIVSFSPNLQNIPIKEEQGKAIRAAFIPSFKGGVILAADYSQIELRILAHISKDEHLLEAFNTNKDIHRFTASLLFSKQEKDVSLSQREFAKRINFGIVYGMSPYGLAKELGVSLDEAESFISEYFVRYPGVKRYIDYTQELAQKQGFVTTIFGRRRYLENIESYNKGLVEYSLRQAINAPIQGTAADIIKLAMIKVFQEFKSRNFSSRLIIQIHDELVFDVEPSELEELKSLTKDIMEKVVSLSVPIKVNIQWGNTWLEASK
ncbi:MAG: DNA polymerase I [Candidatus Omnitrophica bacterium]|nr:DNA polymerase I [Candidatus Omnitrophota bacterium]